MFQYFSSYIQNIVVFLLFSVLVTIIIPSEKYKSYINFVLGLSIMSIVISPVVNILGKEEVNRPEINISENVSQNQSANEYIEKYSNQQSDLVFTEYKIQLKNQIIELVESKTNYKVLDVEVEIVKTSKNYGAISKISISILSNDENNVEILNAKNLKKLLSDFYNLSDTHIDINIES